MNNENIAKHIRGVMLLLLLPASIAATAQNEKIIFDLDKGDFNVKKIPYVHAITITGNAVKGEKPVDAIGLTVTQVRKDEQKDRDALQYKVDQLEKKKADNVSLKAELSSAKDKDWGIDYTVLEKLLLDNKLSDASQKIHNLPADANKATAVKGLLQTEIDKIDVSLKEDETKLIPMKAKILELEKAINEAPFYQGIWQRQGQEKEFAFTLPDRLEISENYIFTFDVYEKNQTSFPIDELLNPLIKDIDKELEDTDFYSKEAISKRVSEVAAIIERKIFPNIYELSPENKVAAKGLHLDQEKLDALTINIEKFYTAKAAVSNNKEAVVSKIKELKDLIVQKAGLVASLRDQMYKKIEDSLSYNKVAFTTDVANAGFVNPPKQAILDAYDKLKDFRDNVGDEVKNVREALASIKKEFDYIKSLYTQKGNITYSGFTSASGATDVDGIRLSTTYGIGVIPLENNFKAIEWYQFVAVNIRFDDFDNRRPGKLAYKTFWSRCAVMVGIATSSDMQYRGQKLDNLRIGIKPVIGLSFEPMHHLSISSGIISFIPQAIGNSQNDPKVRAYISLGFDFNLFNYLIQKQ